MKKRQRVRQFSAKATWIRLVPVCFAFSFGKFVLEIVAYLGHHADYKALLFNVVCLDGFVILKDLSWRVG